MKYVLVIVLSVIALVFADSPWISNVRVSTDQPWDTLNQGESCFDVFGDTVVSVCNTAERGDVPVAPYAYSFDGGQTFTSVPFTDNTTGIIWHTDPVIAFDDSGHVHMIIQYSVNRLKHYLSRDGGQTWADTSNVWNQYGVDKPWMVVNGNEIYITWQQISGQAGITQAISTDYGTTWNTNRIWTRTGITALCMDENENLHLALVDGWPNGDVYYRKSTNKGQAWSSEQYLGSLYYIDYYGDRAPINSIAARGDAVFVTWVDYSQTNTWDIIGVRSSNGGTSWGSPFIINDVTSGGQCKGWALFDIYGGLHVSYYHTPSWPPNSSSLFDFRYQYSPDSGSTFYSNIRISDISVPSLDAFIGEYHITRSDDQYLYAIWTDGRNGDDNDLYFSKALLSELSTDESGTAVPQSKNLLTVPTILSGNTALTLESFPERLQIAVYDITGRVVAHVFSGDVSVRTEIILNANDLPQGILFIKLKSPAYNEVHKVVNLR